MCEQVRNSAEYFQKWRDSNSAESNNHQFRKNTSCGCSPLRMINGAASTYKIDLFPQRGSIYILREFQHKTSSKQNKIIYFKRVVRDESQGPYNFLFNCKTFFKTASVMNMCSMTRFCA